MTRALVLAAALVSASAAAQDPSEAEHAADSLLAAAVDAGRAAFAGHTALAASGSEGDIYFQIGAEGDVRCRAVAADPALAGFVESLCFFALPFVGPDEDGGEDDFAVDSAWVHRDAWDGAETHRIGVALADDPDGMETMEIWLETGTLIVRRLRVEGEMAPGTAFALDVRFDDVRPEAGVPFPRRIRLGVGGVRALFEGMLAEEGMTLREGLAFAEARHKQAPSPDGALAIQMLKAAIADAPFEVDFPIEAVRLDVPLPEGLFDDDGPGT